MKKTITQTTPAAPEPQAKRSPAEILLSFCSQVSAMTQAVQAIKHQIQQSREVIPAPQRAELEQAADGVRAAKRSLTQSRNELAAAHADAKRIAEQNVDDSDLLTANEAVDARRTSYRIGHQKYEGALSRQQAAASRATHAGIHPSPERTAMLYSVI